MSIFKKRKSKEAKQASEPNLDMNQMFQVSEKEFKITMTNMLKSLIEKVDNMQYKQRVGNSKNNQKRNA